MIGPAIKWYLELTGCSQYKLAARLGIHRCTINELVKEGSNPTFLTLMRVCKALNITLSDLARKCEELEKCKEN